MRAVILEMMTERWSSAKWSIPPDFLTRAHFDRVVAGLDWTSSPGYPYMRRSPTNGALFGVVNGVPDPAKSSEIWEMVRIQIREGSSDPIRLFIKAEPHKVKKIEDGRFRLISSVSVVDQIIDHMIFGSMNDMLIKNWSEVPSKIGWSVLYGGWRAMPHWDKWVAADKSSWDWTVNAWLVDMVLEVRCRLCDNLTQQWVDLALWRYKQLFLSPTMITSGGWLLQQVRPGVMKSGCVNTISDNSIMQDILHVRVCQELNIPVGRLFAMGDDTLQEQPDEPQAYFDLLAQYAKMKDCGKINEFAGFRFMGKRIEPLYKGKHAYTLLHVDPKVLPELAASYQLLYHRSVYRNLFEDFFSELGLKVLSREYRDAIFDGC